MRGHGFEDLPCCRMSIQDTVNNLQMARSTKCNVAFGQIVSKVHVRYVQLWHMSGGDNAGCQNMQAMTISIRKVMEIWAWHKWPKTKYGIWR